MDTTKKYIEMCEKAGEIQRQKSWTDADLKDFWVPSETSEFIWLPRQDQLQSILYPKEEANDIYEQFVFHLGHPDDFVELTTYYRQLKTFEQLWLAFVMKEKYNKTWNGMEWVND